MGFSDDYRLWVLFDEEEQGLEFAEGLPERVPGVEPETYVSCWWRSYCDGRVIRLWSGCYGRFDVASLGIPESCYAIEQNEPLRPFEDPDRCFVRLLNDRDFTNDYIYNASCESVVKYDMMFMPKEPSDDAQDEVLEAWHEWNYKCLRGLLRFKVWNYMDAESWPGDYADMTTELPYENWNQGASAQD